MRKLIFPPEKKIGDLGIYPTSPSYSLALTFIEAIIFLTVFYWGTKQGSAPLYHCSILLGTKQGWENLYNGTCSFTGPLSIVHPNIYIQNHTQKAK